MLVIERLGNGSTVVKIKKDWHPNRIASEYKGDKYKDHTRGGLMFQEVVLKGSLKKVRDRCDKLKAAQAALKRKV